MLPDLRIDPPIRGKVRIGTKTNGRPQASDKFHSTDPEFCEALGTPKGLVIAFPFADADECLKTALEWWGANQTLKCWCNDTMNAHFRTREGWVEGACGYRDCKHYTDGKDGGCGPVGRLRFHIPQLSHTDLWQLDTRSWHTIRAVLGTLSLIGHITPELLFRAQVATKTSGNKKFPVIQLTPLNAGPEEEPTVEDE